MEKELTFEGGQSTNTPLTPNSNAIAVQIADLNNDTLISYMSLDATYWSALVSSATTCVINNKRKGNGIVFFKKGLEVEYIALAGGYYTVIVTGEIKDSKIIYNLVGKSLGIFPSA
jgi:hypothetical protein